MLADRPATGLLILMRRLLLPLLVTLSALGLWARPAAAALPVYYDFPRAILIAVAHPGTAPPGANDWSCHPTSRHPRPVVLVHGTFANRTDSWQALSPLLKNSGYCIFTFNYGGSSGNFFQGYGDIPTSAHQLRDFVNRVLNYTGATKVDIVGHSQGGMMPRYYLKYLGGAHKVYRLIGLAPSNHGTNLLGLTLFLKVFPGWQNFSISACPACTQQVAGSKFLTDLNAGGDTVSGVRYTVIETLYDAVVTPYTSAWLAGTYVKNILLQNQCIFDFVDHAAIGYDSIALRDVLNALDPSHAVKPSCHLVLAGIGG